MAVEIIRNGKVIAKSKNLEVLGRYARTTSRVKKTSISKVGSGGRLHVYYKDGAEAKVNFNSYTVLKNWIETKRKRSGWN